MSSSEPIRLNIDFNYGGVNPSTNQGAVMLLIQWKWRSDGDASHVREQFESAGIEPVDGMTVVLVDERADRDDDGNICDMVVIGMLKVVDRPPAMERHVRLGRNDLDSAEPG